MRITIVAVGNKMPKWVEQGYHEYAKRLPRDFSVSILEIAMPSRGKLSRCKNSDIKQFVDKEGELILAAIPKGDKVIALDVDGAPWSTEKLADNIKQWRMQGNNYSLLIGGPDGLSKQCLARADAKWSLSALTLPHPLVRVVLIEQLYRAWSMIENHPYHR